MPRGYHILTAILLINLLSCSTRNDLLSYTRLLDEMSVPGAATFGYIQAYNDTDPLLLIKSIYDSINKKWVFMEDPRGEDTPRSADEMLSIRDYKGDCEDKAVLLMSFIRAMKLSGRFCLGRSESDDTGHIWAEVRIGETKNVTQEVLYKIRSAFPVEEIVEDESVLWLALEENLNTRNYIREFFVYPEDTKME